MGEAEEGLQGQAPARGLGVRGPFLPVKALLACRPALPYSSCREEGEGRLFSTRASALTTAPKCLLRGPADFPSPRTRRPTLPATAAVRFGVSYSARPQHPLPRITPHPSPSRQEARAQDFHLLVAPGQVMWRSRDAGAGTLSDRGGSKSRSSELLGRNTGSLSQSPEPFPGKDQRQPPG